MRLACFSFSSLKHVASDAEASDAFGVSVSMHGDTAVVHEPDTRGPGRSGTAPVLASCGLALASGQVPEAPCARKQRTCLAMSPEGGHVPSAWSLASNTRSDAVGQGTSSRP
jgi:hypothetical protein